MLTVRLMSGISHPIPAHFVLTSSRHALNYHSEKGGFLSNIQKTVQSNTNLPSPKAQHDALLLLMSIVSTELLDVRRLEACNVL